jgi:hypothetical protein
MSVSSVMSVVSMAKAKRHIFKVVSQISRRDVVKMIVEYIHRI